jgi:integrase
LLSLAAPHVRRVIILGWNTGARVGPSELFKLTWADVDLEYGVFRMPSAKKNKNSADARDIPISNFLLPILRKWWEHDSRRGVEYVITWRDRPVKSIGKSWRKCLERAKIRRPIRPYDLRHAYATYALLAGAKIKIIADIMDHSDPSMILKTYQYTEERDRREAIEAMPDHLQLTKAADDCIPGI